MSIFSSQPTAHQSEPEAVKNALDDNEASELRLLRQSYDVNPTKGAHQIAQYLISRYYIKTVDEHDRELLIYQDGVYVPGLEVIRLFLQNFLEEKCKAHVKNEIIEKIKDLTATDRASFVVSRNLINLNNGVFDITTWQLLPHDPKNLFRTKIPVDYSPQADCPLIKRFLAEILGKDERTLVEEEIGYGLYRLYFIKKAFIFVGEPNTGKTTALNVINSFYGKNNVSTVGLQKLSSDKFAAAQLQHKYINTLDDLSSRDIDDTGVFKMVTGGGSMPAEYKFKNRFHFENYAKLIFACNKIPDVKDTDDDAYFSRWIVVRFNKEIEKTDKFLTEKLTTPAELSGLLNLALEGLKRLLANGDFSYDKTPEEIKIEMMKSGSALAGFAASCIVQDSDNWVSKDNLHTAFKGYANENKLTVMGIINFGRQIKKHAPYLEDGKKTINKAQVTGWRNVRLTTYQPVSESPAALPLEESDAGDSSDLKGEGDSRDSRLY
jgi:P4 family phage/plasmid primase-like protien